MHGNPQAPYPQPVIVQKKRGGCLKGILIAGAVFAVLIAIGAALGGSDDAKETTASSNPGKAISDKKAEDTPKQPGVGDIVKDGKFAFKVTKVEKGLAQVGEGMLASKAQGQYILIHLTVKNIGDEAQMFSDSEQKLIDAKGRQFDADSGAAALGLKDSNAFLKNINPGNSVRGIVLFDVPKSFRLKSIELHGSVFSGGVTVALS